MKFDWVKRLDEIWPRDGRYIKCLSPEWWQARRGRLTASSAAYPIKVYGRAIPNLAKKIRAQMEPGWEPTELDLPQLNWGRVMEPRALASAEMALGVQISDPGCLFHPRLPFCSGTPDGIIDGHISVQVKCPAKAEFHLDVLYDRKPLKPLYLNQCHWEAWCAGCDEVLFISFDARQPLNAQLAFKEFKVDHELQDRFEANSLRFKELLECGVATSNNAKPDGIPWVF